MAHYFEVQKRLGESNVRNFLEVVRSGEVSDDGLKEISLQLGKMESRPKCLYGPHRMRMERSRDKPQDAEMRDILSDWWNEELYGLTQEEGLRKLTAAFKASEQVSAETKRANQLIVQGGNVYTGTVFQVRR